MSKLAHSDDEAMADIEVRRAIIEDDYDRVGLTPLYKPPRCEEAVSQGRWDDKINSFDGRCSYGARYQTSTGIVLCEMHARRWATKFIQGT